MDDLLNDLRCQVINVFTIVYQVYHTSSQPGEVGTIGHAVPVSKYYVERLFQMLSSQNTGPQGRCITANMTQKRHVEKPQKS